jgi:hypothetical protein
MQTEIVKKISYRRLYLLGNGLGKYLFWWLLSPKKQTTAALFNNLPDNSFRGCYAAVRFVWDSPFNMVYSCSATPLNFSFIKIPNQSERWNFFMTFWL